MISFTVGLAGHHLRAVLHGVDRLPDRLEGWLVRDSTSSDRPDSVWQLEATDTPSPPASSEHPFILEKTAEGWILRTYSYVLELPSGDSRTLRGRFLQDFAVEKRILVLLRMSFAWIFASERSAVMLHSSSVFSPWGAFLILGRSGAGKTTAARTSPWPVGSDEVNVLVPSSTAMLHSTPFGGEVDPTPATAPLAAVFTIRRCDLNPGTYPGILWPRSPMECSRDLPEPYLYAGSLDSRQLLGHSFITFPDDATIRWSERHTRMSLRNVPYGILFTDSGGKFWEDLYSGTASEVFRHRK